VNGKITIDGAGRIIIPKPIREELQLKPGDALELESRGEQITLRPVRPKATLKKEYGVWVYQGEPTDISIVDVIAREREKRIRELIK
jgi:AbrB family looped-hinge helix DNA binding protein